MKIGCNGIHLCYRDALESVSYGPFLTDEYSDLTGYYLFNTNVGCYRCTNPLGLDPVMDVFEETE
jgi:hypothetical protein